MCFIVTGKMFRVSGLRALLRFIPPAFSYCCSRFMLLREATLGAPPRPRNLLMASRGSPGNLPRPRVFLTPFRGRVSSTVPQVEVLLLWPGGVEV